MENEFKNYQDLISYEDNIDEEALSEYYADEIADIQMMIDSMEDYYGE